MSGNYVKTPPRSQASSTNLALARNKRTRAVAARQRGIQAVLAKDLAAQDIIADDPEAGVRLTAAMRAATSIVDAVGRDAFRDLAYAGSVKLLSAVVTGQLKVTSADKATPIIKALYDIYRIEQNQATKIIEHLSEDEAHVRLEEIIGKARKVS